jgi:hypothetical protein
MKFIGKNSDYDSANNSVRENTDKIVSWKIENTDKFLIKNIDEIESYIITNNLGELINMLVYVIYEKIFNEKILDDFISRNDPLSQVCTKEYILGVFKFGSFLSIIIGTVFLCAFSVKTFEV